VRQRPRESAGEIVGILKFDKRITLFIRITILKEFRTLLLPFLTPLVDKEGVAGRYHGIAQEWTWCDLVPSDQGHKLTVDVQAFGRNRLLDGLTGEDLLGRKLDVADVSAQLDLVEVDFGGLAAVAAAVAADVVLVVVDLNDVGRRYLLSLLMTNPGKPEDENPEDTWLM